MGRRRGFASAFSSAFLPPSFVFGRSHRQEQASHALGRRAPSPLSPPLLSQRPVASHPPGASKKKNEKNITISREVSEGKNVFVDIKVPPRIPLFPSPHFILLNSRSKRIFRRRLVTASPSWTCCSSRGTGRGSTSTLRCYPSVARSSSRLSQQWSRKP